VCGKVRQQQLILVASMVWVLLAQTAWGEDRVKRTLRQSTNIAQFNETSVLELVQSPPSATEIVSITEVKINPTEAGIEIILVTAQSDRLQISTSNEGNVYTAIVPNAQLSKPFRQEKPTAGINSIAVSNLDDQTIQVTVTGETNLPTVELFDSEEGLIFSATNTETSTSPTSDPFPPLQGRTQGGQIESGESQESQESQIIPVTGVQLNPTDTGIELLLQTPPGSTELLQTRDRSQGNNFIVDIPNAQLSKPFRQPNPVEGISEVSAINFDASTIRVTAAGETTLPQVESFDTDEGLIFGFTPVVPSAQTPTTPQPQEGQIVQIDRVQLNPTETRFEILLLTPTGDAQNLRVVNISEGNNFIAEIQGAQLQQPFREEKPIEGVSEVTITNRDENTVLVTVIGEEKQPTVELFDSKDGLIFSAQSERGEEDIELVVTGDRDTGYRVPATSTATRTDTPIRDIPQSIQIVPQEVIEDQQITRITDAARNVSGVSPQTEFSGAYDSLTIRGFTNFNILRNGVRIQNPAIGGFNIERVEVLKGPASVLYGQFEPGGIVNYVTKQPLRDPYYSAEFTAGSYDYYRPAIDISGPLNSDKTLLYRLNIAYENSGSFRDFIGNEVFSISPVLSYKIGDSTDLRLEYEYVSIDNSFDRGLRPQEFTFDLPINRNLGEPDDFYRSDNHFIALSLDHRFSDSLRFKTSFSGSFSHQESSYVNPGDEFEADGRSLLRSYVEGPGYVEDLSWQTDLIGKFNTWSIEHQLLFGFEVSQSIYNYEQSQVENFSSLNVFNPDYGFPRPTSFDIGDKFDSTTNTVGIYLQDQVTLLPNLKLLVGGRYDFVDYKSENIPDTINGSEVEKSSFYDEAFSPRVGIVYQPIEELSLYASYSRSFVPNNNNATASGEPLPPSRGTQYEVGLKAEITPDLSLTLAAYDITKTNVPTVDPNDDRFTTALGEVKSRGIELDISGEILPGWNIIASAYLNDAFVSEDNDPVIEGARLENAAYHGASLWTTYEIQSGNLQGLGFGGGLFFVGDRIANQSDPFTLPSYVRIDTAIFYKRENWRVALNFKNLFNVKAYDTNGYLIFPQAPFTVFGTVAVEF
jgi:iron complex outermembrane recepter protein